MYHYTTSDIKFPIGSGGMIKIDTNSYCPKDFGINDKDSLTCGFNSVSNCLECWDEALKDIGSAEIIFHKKEENHEIVTILPSQIVASFQVQYPDKEFPEIETIEGNSVAEVLHEIGERFSPEIEKCVSDKLLGQN